MVYKRTNWGPGNEPLDNDKLNEMVSNVDYVYDNMITGYYNVFGVIRETGLTFRTASCKMVPTESEVQTVSHYFPKPFVPGVRPIVVSGFGFDIKARVFTGIRGFDGSAFPDHKGFDCIFVQDRRPDGPSEIAGAQWYNYLAIGPNAG